jgi:hypothetical protein|tara:strand:- start:931 stop:2400 length:1470 start_codon:yes stop_codon:yes gene_type:complete
MAQIVVYGPNGARTTANNVLTELDKARGFTKSEYERLLDGEIPGREGYKDADKNYQSPELLTPDYPGDYGGEDASTPMDERESVVGVGNTNYDPKDYTTVDESGDVVITQDGVPVENLQTIPQGGEIVKSGDMYFVLYPIPGSNVQINYSATEQDIRGLLPLTFDNQTFREVNSNYIASTVPFGNIAELYNPEYLQQGLTPWEGFIDYLDKEAELRPWLDDEEMVFLLAEATLEGRAVTEAEWKTTNWWRTHTQDERDWLLLSQGKPLDDLPQDAVSKVQDDKIQIRNLMQQAGIANPPENVVNWVSNKFTSGNWSSVYTQDQIGLIADPSKIGNLDEELQDFISGVDIDSTTAGEDRVTQLYNRYLGPVFGNINDTLIAEEAGKLRNDVDYETELIKKLTAQKKSLFPMYEENVTYEEFAAPWQNFTNNEWGTQIDTTSDVFQEVLKLNDSTKVSKYLTQKGLEQGVDKVVNQALDAMKVFGQGVRIV